MTNRSLALELVPGLYTVCRLDAGASLPSWAGAGPFTSVTWTDAELSIVCAQEAVPTGVRSERDWRCLRVKGPLGFGMTGVLASLAAPLASSGVSIFVVSTFDTDYVLVKQSALEAARVALQAAGHRFVQPC